MKSPSHNRAIRLYSLDTFRGLTIAAMILANVDSLAPSVHPWFSHAYWNGCTLADWVFPFFLFIVGVSMAFSLSKYNQDHKPTKALYWRLLKRSAILFSLGIIINGFWSYEWGKFELSGVLQRIAISYFVTALIVLNLPRKAQWATAIFLLLGYWIAYIIFPIAEPKYVADGLTHAEIGSFGMMSWFGMMNAIAIVLMGYLTGAWLHVEVVIKELRSSRHSMTLVLFGLSSMAIGQIWNLWMPINKKLWTSSYAMFTVGIALLLLAVCFELIEVRKYQRWSYPAKVLGSNSIFIYVSSELMIKLLEKTHIVLAINAPTTYRWLEERLFLIWTDPIASGLLFALCNLLFWWLVAYYLYRRSWSISV